MTIAILESVNFGLRHLAAAARDRGHDVILLTEDRSRYAYELAGPAIESLRIVDVDTGDVDAVTAVLSTETGLVGLVRMSDPRSLQALAVAERLDLPHENSEAVHLLRDKGRLRRHLHDHGFSAAASVVLDLRAALVDDLLEQLAGMVYPCIVKDVAGSLSQNVWLVRDARELPRVLAAAQQSETLLSRAVTVEPYFVGPMYSAETVSWDGETRVMGVSSRGLSPEPSFREETASFPVEFPEKTRLALTEWLSAILKSVGYRAGVTHTEFIVTTTGFEIVEINTRLGGALIGESINRSLGINVHSAFIDLALGRRPAVMDGSGEVLRGSAQIAIYAPTAGVFDGIDGATTLLDHPGAPELFTLRERGDVIISTSDQRGLVAVVFTDGDTSELAMHNAVSAAGKLTVRMR
jgi:biotin carboxylase